MVRYTRLLACSPVTRAPSTDASNVPPPPPPLQYKPSRSERSQQRPTASRSDSKPSPRREASRPPSHRRHCQSCHRLLSVYNSPYLPRVPSLHQRHSITTTSTINKPRVLQCPQHHVRTLPTSKPTNIRRSLIWRALDLVHSNHSAIDRADLQSRAGLHKLVRVAQVSDLPSLLLATHVYHRSIDRSMIELMESRLSLLFRSFASWHRGIRSSNNNNNNNNNPCIIAR